MISIWLVYVLVVEFVMWYYDSVKLNWVNMEEAAIGGLCVKLAEFVVMVSK